VGAPRPESAPGEGRTRLDLQAPLVASVRRRPQFWRGLVLGLASHEPTGQDDRLVVPSGRGYGAGYCFLLWQIDRFVT